MEVGAGVDRDKKCAEEWFSLGGTASPVRVVLTLWVPRFSVCSLLPGSMCFRTSAELHPLARHSALAPKSCFCPQKCTGEPTAK